MGAVAPPVLPVSFPHPWRRAWKMRRPGLSVPTGGRRSAAVCYSAPSWRCAAVGAAGGWVWPMLAFGPPAAGALLGLLIGRCTGTEISAGGIRTLSVFADDLAPWHRVVDLRAERRGGRTVVSVYLDSGTSVQLQAPYDGDLFAADPRFEVKMFALSHIWRSNRFGGLPG